MDLKAARNARLVEQSTSQAGTSASDPGPASEPVPRFASLVVESHTLDALVVLLSRAMVGIDALTIARGLNEFRGKMTELQNRLDDLQHHLSGGSTLTMACDHLPFRLRKHSALARVERTMRCLIDVLESAVEDGEPGLILERLESSMNLETPWNLNVHLLLESIDHLNSQASFWVNGDTRALERAVSLDIIHHFITALSNADMMHLLSHFPQSHAPSFEDVYSLILEVFDRRRQGAVKPLLNLRCHGEGPAFLQKALRENELMARMLIRDHLELVSQGENFWLRELRESGHSTQELVSLLVKDMHAGPWLLDEDPELLEVDWKLDIDLHQGHCVHNGPSTKELAITYDLADWSQHSWSRCQMRRNVFGYCGLAGVTPYTRSDVVFDRQSASILYSGDSSSISRTMIFAQMLPDPGLTYSQVGIIMELNSATTRFCEAAAILQQSKFCCNSFTIFIRRPRRTTSKPVMDLVVFSIRTLNEYSEALSALSRALKSSNMDDYLGRCVDISEKLLSVFAVPDAVDRAQLAPSDLPSTLNYKLHLCALAVQLLGFGLAAYSQAHIGPLGPDSLKCPIHELYLRGIIQRDLYLVARVQELTCLGEMVGGPVLVIELCCKDSSSVGDPTPVADFRGRGIDIIDTWGPGALISKRESEYGQQVYAIELGGGVIVPSDARIAKISEDIPNFHWYRHIRHYSAEAPTFSIYDGILIGAISTYRDCPIEASKFCEESSSRRFYIGTWPDYWELTQRQVALQTGSYAVLQVGNIYGRKFGMTLKRLIIEQWSLSSDFGILDLPWGLQVSSCTGIAKRVPLHTLVEHLSFSDMHENRHGGFHKAELRLRQQWRAKMPSRFGDWAEELSTQDKADLATSIDFLLRVLEHTGLNQKNQTLSMFALGSSKLSHGIAFSYNTTPPSNRWAHMLRDSESCATFAAMTPLCLVTDHHKCQSMEKRDRFQGLNGGPCLSTVLSHYLPATSSTNASTRTPWQLDPGRKYWVGKVGSEIMVDAVSKGHDRETELVLKTRHYPGMIARRLGYEVLREKQEAECGGEEVLIFDERAWPE